LIGNQSQIHVYFDGLCQPYNPEGTACYAFIIKNEENTIYSDYGLAAHDSTNNNVAEYTGITKALEWLFANNYENKNIVIKGDSLVINQIERNFKVKAPTIIPLYHKAMSLIYKFNNIRFEWILREQNKEADKLANYAYTKVIADNPNLEKNQQGTTPEQNYGVSHDSLTLLDNNSPNP
jgi:ribonuclease HI